MAFKPDGTQILYSLGDLSFVICATALVWVMIPGVGFFYSGLLRRKNALSMIYTSLASVAVVTFQVGPSISIEPFYSFFLLKNDFVLVVFLGLFISV